MLKDVILSDWQRLLFVAHPEVSKERQQGALSYTDGEHVNWNKPF